jgi:hypothetical protein
MIAFYADKKTLTICILSLMRNKQSVQVSDTTKPHYGTAARHKKILL